MYTSFWITLYNAINNSTYKNQASDANEHHHMTQQWGKSSTTGAVICATEATAS
jgi:hypothetical protein